MKFLSLLILFFFLSFPAFTYSKTESINVSELTAQQHEALNIIADKMQEGDVEASEIFKAVNNIDNSKNIFFDLLLFTLLTPFFCFLMYLLFQKFVLGIVITTEKKLHSNPVLRLLGFGEVSSKTEVIKEEIIGGEKYWKPIIWLVIIALSFSMYYEALWPM